MDEDDWARRMGHRTAGIAAVKRRAKDSGLSRFERWAGSTGCPLRAGYMNPGAGRALRERCSTSSSIETMALLGVSTKCACVDKWLLHNGLAPMATVPSKSSVTLSTDLRGFFERDRVQVSSPESVHRWLRTQKDKSGQRPCREYDVKKYDHDGGGVRKRGSISHSGGGRGNGRRLPRVGVHRGFQCTSSQINRTISSPHDETSTGTAPATVEVVTDGSAPQHKAIPTPSRACCTGSLGDSGDEAAENRELVRR